MKTGLGRYARIAPAAGGGFAPTDISGCVGWYDASNAGSITASGGAVSQWNDLSSSARHLVQGTGTRQPTTGTRTQNSLNVIDFDGGDDIYYGSSVSIKPFTMFAVCTLDAGGGTLQITGAPNGSGDNFRAAFNVFLASMAGNNQSFGVADTAGPIIMAYAGADGSQERWANGASAGTSSIATLDGLVYIGLGARQDHQNFMNGWVAEYIIYDSKLSTTNVNTVNSYLSAKWAI